MESQKQPATRTKALTKEDKLVRSYDEVFSSEQSYIDAMKEFAKELTRLRDTGFVIQAESLKGKKSKEVKVSDEDYAILTELIKMVEGLASCPLLDPPINTGNFNNNFRELIKRTSPQNEAYQNYFSKISDYTLQFDFIAKTLTDISKKYLNERYLNKTNQKSAKAISNEINNKIFELSAKWIQPVQRGMRHDILFDTLSKNLTGELFDTEEKKLDENHKNIKSEVVKINERKRKAEAFLDTATYSAQSNMLKTLVQTIETYYKEKIDSLPPEKQSAFPVLQKEFEGISRFRGRAFSKEGWENKFKKVDANDPVNDAIYQVFSPNEKLLYKAFKHLGGFHTGQTKEIAKQQKIIDDLIKLITLEQKRAYIAKAKNISSEMKKETELLVKQGILSKWDLKSYHNRIQKLEKNYLAQQKEVSDEIAKIESRLGKSRFVAEAKDNIKREIKIDKKRESVAAPLGQITLPPETLAPTLPPTAPPPPLPTKDAVMSSPPPPTDIPPPPADIPPPPVIKETVPSSPPLPADLPPASSPSQPEKSLADMLAAVPPPTDMPPAPPPPTDIPPPPSLPSNKARNVSGHSEEEVPAPKYIPLPPQPEGKTKTLRSKTQNIPHRTAHLSTTADLFVSMNGKPEDKKASRQKTSWINRLTTKLSAPSPQQKFVTENKEIKSDEKREGEGDPSTPRKSR